MITTALTEDILGASPKHVARRHSCQSCEMDTTIVPIFQMRKLAGRFLHLPKVTQLYQSFALNRGIWLQGAGQDGVGGQAGIIMGVPSSTAGN